MAKFIFYFLCKLAGMRPPVKYSDDVQRCSRESSALYQEYSRQTLLLRVIPHYIKRTTALSNVALVSHSALHQESSTVKRCSRESLCTTSREQHCQALLWWVTLHFIKGAALSNVALVSHSALHQESRTVKRCSRESLCTSSREQHCQTLLSRLTLHAVRTAMSISASTHFVRCVHWYL